MKEAVLYRREDDTVVCTACSRYCRLSDGQTGFCGVRKNVGGHLNLLNYGIAYAVQIDPIEKKPILHMKPGASILSIGTTGCNFSCRYCQNYDMSQRKEILGDRIDPERIVKLALAYGCDGIAFTYNEPTIFMEYAHDVGVLARKHGLINIFVTNGYETTESIEYASDFLDAATVDFKGNGSPEFYRRYIAIGSVEPIYDTIKALIDHSVHVEITDLVVPHIGDSLEEAEKMISRILRIGGNEIPVSFLRFHPDYLLRDIEATPTPLLEEHLSLARNMGVSYAYIGNVPGHQAQSTYCPKCGAMLIKRDTFSSEIVSLDHQGRCKKCGYHTGIIL